MNRLLKDDRILSADVEILASPAMVLSVGDWISTTPLIKGSSDGMEVESSGGDMKTFRTDCRCMTKVKGEMEKRRSVEVSYQR